MGKILFQGISQTILKKTTRGYQLLYFTDALLKSMSGKKTYVRKTKSGQQPPKNFVQVLSTWY